MSSELRKYGSTSVVQTSNVGFTSEVYDYLVVHTGPDVFPWLYVSPVRCSVTLVTQTPTPFPSLYVFCHVGHTNSNPFPFTVCVLSRWSHKLQPLSLHCMCSVTLVTQTPTPFPSLYVFCHVGFTKSNPVPLAVCVPREVFCHVGSTDSNPVPLAVYTQ